MPKAVRLAACVFAVLALAGPSRALEFGSGESAQALGDFTDAVFVAGEEVAVRATTDDDIFAAGRRVSVSETRADHLFSAAGLTRITSGEFRDVLAATGEAQLVGGSTADDVIILAGQADLGAGFTIGGSALITAGEVTIASPIGGELRVAGESVRLDGPVTGDADISAERLVIGPNARIGGDLTYEAGSIEISPQAVITGKRTARAPQRPHAAEQVAGAMAGAAAVALVLMTLGLAVLTLVIVAVFPGLMIRAAARLETWPLSVVGIGFLTVLLGPAAIVALCFTMVGIPLAMTIAAFFVATAPLAMSATAYWLGMRGRMLAKRGAETPPLWPRLGWTLLAVIAMAIVFAIPFVGLVLWLIAYVIGLGAVVVEGRKSLAAA